MKNVLGKCVKCNIKCFLCLLTCKNDYDESTKYVRILCQCSWYIQGHVLSAELPYGVPYQLIKGGAPCTSHAGGTWDEEKNILEDKFPPTHDLKLGKTETIKQWCFMLTNDVGKNEIPSSDEGPQLPYSHIGVQISRACFGNTGSKLSVAKPG